MHTCQRGRARKPPLGLIARVIAAASLLPCAAAAFGCAAARREAQQVELRVAHRAQERAGEIVWRVNTRQKVVALTFDDGPDPTYTPTVLRLARDRGLKLTFFLVGREIQLHPDLVRQEVAEGHAIGNHTWDHQVLTRDTPLQGIPEIERCEDEIEKVCGERTHLFRPPKGYWDGDVFLEAEGLGYRMILWSVALEHHSSRTPQAMAARVLRRIRPGVIILAHDGEPCGPIDRSRTVKALPILVNGLQERGYRFVTVPELLELRSANR